MSYDPMDDVVDHPLTVSAEMISRLKELRAAEKFLLLPGVDIEDERARLSVELNSLIDEIISGIGAHPSKTWVLGSFKGVLERVGSEDTEAREHFGMHLEQIMDAVGIESSDGLLSFYLGGI